MFAIMPLRAQACHCLEPQVGDAYARSTVVAMIRVQDVKPSDDGQVAEGEVLAAWKGNLPAVTEFVSLSGCDYPVAKGEFYLVFLERTLTGQLTTERCRGNRLRSEAAVSLFWLNRYGRASSVEYDQANPPPPWSLRMPGSD
jgi:hypothetical protein